MQQKPKRRFIGCTISLVALAVIALVGLTIASVLYQDTNLFLILLGLLGLILFLTWSAFMFWLGGRYKEGGIVQGFTLAHQSQESLINMFRYGREPAGPRVVNQPAYLPQVLPGGPAAAAAYTTGNYDIVVDGLEEDD